MNEEESKQIVEAIINLAAVDYEGSHKTPHTYTGVIVDSEITEIMDDRVTLDVTVQFKNKEENFNVTHNAVVYFHNFNDMVSASLCENREDAAKFLDKPQEDNQDDSGNEDTEA